MSRFNLDDYEPVDARLERFWADHPDGQIITHLIEFRDDGSIVFKAEAYTAGRLLATGWAMEVIGSTPVNRQSALENCETSAIGRALANCGYAPKGKRPSREEMTKATGVGPPQDIPDPKVAQGRLTPYVVGKKQVLAAAGSVDLAYRMWKRACQHLNVDPDDDQIDLPTSESVVARAVELLTLEDVPS